MVKHAEWNYDTNGGDNLCHKSILETKTLTPMYKNEWRMNDTKSMPIYPMWRRVRIPPP
jgi:hypothetical protein